MSLVGKIESVYKDSEAETAEQKTLIQEYDDELLTRTYVAVLASRRACLDAHDQERRLTDDSPLVAMRTMNVAELGFED